jgi:hypothetical protein
LDITDQQSGTPVRGEGKNAVDLAQRRRPAGPPAASKKCGVLMMAEGRRFG